MSITNLLNRCFYSLIQRAIIVICRFSNKPGKVFMLHHVTEKNKDDEFSITVEDLEHFLIDKKNKTIRLIDWKESKIDFCAFTIDDVPEDFYKNGFPLFQKLKIPFTIFVNTSLLNTSGYINTSQLKEMACSKLCTVGSHGTTHTFYKVLSLDQKYNFLKQSKDILENICGKPIELFAFPYGSLFACGLSSLSLTSKLYKYSFGTIPAKFSCRYLTPEHFLPRHNLNKQYLMHCEKS